MIATGFPDDDLPDDHDEGPLSTLEMAVRVAASTVEEAKGQVAGVIASERMLDSDIRQAVHAANEWGGKAELAALAGRDDVVKDALGQRRKWLAMVATYTQERDTQHQMVVGLKMRFEELARKYDAVVRVYDAFLAQPYRVTDDPFYDASSEGQGDHE